MPEATGNIEDAHAGYAVAFISWTGDFASGLGRRLL